MLLSSLQNFNQYDSEFDSLKQQLCKLLMDADSTSLLQSVVEEIYTKVMGSS
jgi:hypothetical protein